MIFSRFEREKAFSYMSLFYDKILRVDLEKNTFDPVKISDSELLEINKYNTFTDWVMGFCNAIIFKPYGDNRSRSEFEKYYDIDYLRTLRKPLVLYYQKFINNEYHDVELIFLPIGRNEAYVYVRDNTKLERTFTYEEERF